MTLPIFTAGCITVMIISPDVCEFCSQCNLNWSKWFLGGNICAVFLVNVNVFGLFPFLKRCVWCIVCVCSGWVYFFFNPVCSVLLYMRWTNVWKASANIVQQCDRTVQWLQSSLEPGMEAISLPTQPLHWSQMCGILALTSTVHLNVGYWCKTDCCKLNEVGAEYENKALS